MRTAGWVMACAVVLGFGAAHSARAQGPEFTPKVTDVTVFKDGHALIMARAKVKPADGWCRTKDVPAPVLGTFWAFVKEKDSQVDSIKAAPVETKETGACMTLDEIIQANVGKPVTVVTVSGTHEGTHEGTLLGILEAETEREVTSARPPPDRYDRYGRNIVSYIPETEGTKSKSLASFVMLKTDKGVKMVKRDGITSVLVADDKPVTTITRTTTLREISMHVVSKGKPVNDEREVGMVYLQKGIRWIPEYRIELLADGKAKVTLQGTVINDIVDLDNVDLRLVVGVPSFIMKDNLSPLALREAGLPLSSYFAPPREGRGREADWQYFGNTMMSQGVAVMPAPPGEGGIGGPAIPMEGQQEDLFLYQKPGFSLKKGERAVVQLLEVTAPYEDIYTWEIAPLPPARMWENMNQEQRKLLASLTGAKAIHCLRLTNNGEAPWTTGPATIYKDNTPLAQQLMTYTSRKNKVDVPVTTATDLNTRKEETEVAREPNISINGYPHTKVKLHGKLTVTSFKDKPVRITITRKTFGTATEATAKGRIVLSNALEDTSLATGRDLWVGWSWPWWWLDVNPLSEITWEATIPAGKMETFEYDWYYYMRH